MSKAPPGYGFTEALAKKVLIVSWIGVMVSVLYFTFFQKPIICDCLPNATVIPEGCATGIVPYIPISYNAFQPREKECYPIDTGIFLKPFPMTTYGAGIRLLLQSSYIRDGYWVPTFGPIPRDYIFFFWLYSTSLALLLDSFNFLPKTSKPDIWTVKNLILAKIGGALLWLFILFRSQYDPIGYFYLIQFVTTAWVGPWMALLFFGDGFLHVFLLLGGFFLQLLGTVIDPINFLAGAIIFAICVALANLGKIFPTGGDVCSPV
jgi:hypothetical protein